MQLYLAFSVTVLAHSFTSFVKADGVLLRGSVDNDAVHLKSGSIVYPSFPGYNVIFSPTSGSSDSEDVCVDVNHQYDSPGEVTCDCVSPQDPCLMPYKHGPRMGPDGADCIPDESCLEENQEVCVDVNHQYDSPGEVTCDCVSPQDPCLTDMGPDGADCIPDESCLEENQEVCVDVNHQYNSPGEVTCDCVSPQDPCLTDMGPDGADCIPDESCLEENQ